jgi:hypothetical protein
MNEYKSELHEILLKGDKLVRSAQDTVQATSFDYITEVCTKVTPKNES